MTTKLEGSEQVAGAEASGPHRLSATGRATDLALIATFAALIAVCSLLTGPAVSGVPITLQTFAVLLAGIVLGPWRGAGAVALYIVVGLAGLPIFAGGKAGLAVLSGPSVGYLLSFPLAAAIAGAWLRFARKSGPSVVLVHGSIGVVLATLAIYAVGIPVMAARLGIPFSKALVGNLAFVPFDAIKAALAVAVGAMVLRAYPQLTRR
ncbi:BioY family transporter [Rarobacter faecitabidus]|uniref:Biotin transporter n=1 Tax=Rarobacter faecitabidus TaxID=13243 RepID=A0A542ZVC8_RARFA|nr:biotin transporter BioY [Rarobacter faecitabidus]TQL64315.1 biotin transport system substrate-specific component [Rarobacter faecitabidus]